MMPLSDKMIDKQVGQFPLLKTVRFIQFIIGIFRQFVTGLTSIIYLDDVAKRREQSCLLHRRETSSSRAVETGLAYGALFYCPDNVPPINGDCKPSPARGLQQAGSTRSTRHPSWVLRS